MTDAAFPFHTAVVEGVEVVGVMFDGSSGRFYEFQNPADHDEYERYVDPRSGEEIVYDSSVQRMVADIMNGRPRATVPAAEWASFRAEYLDADEADYDMWADRWEGIAASDPRFEGGVDMGNA